MWGTNKDIFRPRYKKYTHRLSLKQILNDILQQEGKWILEETGMQEAIVSSKNYS